MLLRRFLQAKSAEGISPSTIQWYDRNIRLFLDHHSDAATLRPHHVIEFLNLERDRGMSIATLLCRYRALSAYFNWLGWDTMATIKRPKPPRRLPRRAEYATVQRLINKIPSDHWLDTRDKAIISLMIDTGLRVGEVEQLVLDSVDIANRTVMVPAGKDKEERLVVFTDTTGKLLLAYLMNRPPTHHTALFISSRAFKAITGWGIRQMMERRCAECEVDYINPHSLRHCFATKALNDGMPISTVSYILGHSSTDFTLRTYARLLTRTVREEYANFWKQGD